MMKTVLLILVLTTGALGSIEKRVTGWYTRYCREGEGKHQVMLSRTTLRDPQHEYFSTVFCGGTRIRSKWILTAAHCNNDAGGKTARHCNNARIVEKVEYPGHDLMLLKLRRRIRSNGKTKAELPDLNACTTPPIGETVDIFGWQDAYINKTGHMFSYNAGTLRCGKMKVRTCSTHSNGQKFCGMAFHVDGNEGDSGSGAVWNDKLHGVQVSGPLTFNTGRTRFMDLCHGPYRQWIKDTAGV